MDEISTPTSSQTNRILDDSQSTPTNTRETLASYQNMQTRPRKAPESVQSTQIREKWANMQSNFDTEMRAFDSMSEEQKRETAQRKIMEVGVELKRVKEMVVEGLTDLAEGQTAIRENVEMHEGNFMEVQTKINEICECFQMFTLREQEREMAVRHMEFAKSDREILWTGVPMEKLPPRNDQLKAFTVDLMTTEMGLNPDRLNWTIVGVKCGRKPTERRRNSGVNNAPSSAPIFIELRHGADRNEILQNSRHLKTGRLQRMFPRRHKQTVDKMSDKAFKLHKDSAKDLCDRIKTRLTAVYNVDLGMAIGIQTRKPGDNQPWIMKEIEKAKAPKIPSYLQYKRTTEDRRADLFDAMDQEY